jgi:hypothetical protein
MKTSKTTIAIAAIAVIALLASATALYTMSSLPSVPVTVNPSPTPSPTASPPPEDETLSQVQVSATSIQVGDDLTLTTQVSDHTEGLTVTFLVYGEDTVIGTADTDESGTASLTIIANSVGTFQFYATADYT